MDLRFDGRAAVVTGAGNGLGRQHALLLAARGARVVVNDVGSGVDGSGTSDTAAAAVVREIEAGGGTGVASYDSVASPEGGEAIVDTALQTFGRVDIIVNNAGIIRDKAFHNMTPEMVRAVIDVHLLGAFWVTRPAWPRMREQGYGRVILTSSASGILGNFGQSNYGAAKMGLLGLLNVLEIEGRRHDIKVNAIAPMAQTRMTGEIEGIGAKVDPALVSPVVAYLAHEECAVSGEVFSVAGGRVARMFVGVTPGFFDPALTPESLREHLDEARELDGFVVPDDATGEMPLLMRHLA